MFDRGIYKRLKQLYEGSPVIDITPDDRIVIFSDMHLGNGKYRDDFAHNGDLFLYLLEHHYYPEKYHLMLNGDIEELYKFPMKRILSRWQGIYRMFEKFWQRKALTKLLGNHDYKLPGKHFPFPVPIIGGCKLKYRSDHLFICHGHHAGRLFRFLEPLANLLIRYIASPLGIKNYSVAFNSRKKYKLEKRIYNFAVQEKILALIGHTHRPLFESLSKVDSLKFEIENLCRHYPKAKPGEKPGLEKRIKKYKEELQALLHARKNKWDSGSLYAEEPVVPCVFNSGCCIGKNGVTAIEISGGNIELVYWFHQKRTRKYFNLNGYDPRQLKDSDYFRVTLKKESLEYIFSRVKLLT